MRLCCLFGFHQSGEPVHVPLTEAQKRRAKELNCGRVYNHPSITCVYCGRELNRIEGRWNVIYEKDTDDPHQKELIGE